MFLSSFLGGCNIYRTVRVEVLQPAEFYVNKENRIALFDRGLNWEENAVQFKEAELTDELLLEFKNGVQSRLEEMGYDSVKLLGNQQRNIVYDSIFPEPIPADTIDAFCSRFHVDYIISLEGVKYVEMQDFIRCIWYIRLYGKFTSEPVDSVSLTHDLPMESFQDDPYLLFDILASLFWEKGNSYACRIVPSWHETERRLYCNGRTLALGCAFFNENKLEEAAAVWEAICNVSDKKALQAYINLAWLYESIGNFQYALQLLHSAEALSREQKYNTKILSYLQDYIHILENRVNTERILENQIYVPEN